MMRRSNREMSKEARGAVSNTAHCKMKSRSRVHGAIGTWPVWFVLIAILVVALPGFAQEFRGNPFPLGGSSKTADVSAGVDGTSGAATLSIPIAVPPGTGGLAPTLSLNYSSDRGDGPFGLGWDLQLGEIRCTARLGVPDYVICSDFELDGQLLVGPDGQDRYHTQVESFQRIRLVDSGPSSPYWEVTAPGGTRRLYGATTDSKIGSDGLDTPSTAPTARWLLSMIVDLHGNEILITYDRSDVGVAYPSTITYALGEREVTFLYQSRPDEILDFPGGIPRNITQRLSDIVITSVGETFSRRIIEYSTAADGYSTHRSRITSTQLFGKGCDRDELDPVENCASLPAQTFSYTKTTGTHWPSTPDPTWNTGFFVENYLEWSIWFDTGKRIADVNGDGLPDLVDGLCSDGGFPCNLPNQGPIVFINDGAGWVQNIAWTDAIDSLTYEVPTVTPDIQATPFPVTTAICGATYGSLERKIVFADERADSEPLPGTTGTYAAWPGWQIVDINGDGFADLVSSVKYFTAFQAGRCF